MRKTYSPLPLRQLHYNTFTDSFQQKSINPSKKTYLLKKMLFFATKLVIFLVFFLFCKQPAPRSSDYCRTIRPYQPPHGESGGSPQAFPATASLQALLSNLLLILRIILLLFLTNQYYNGCGSCKQYYNRKKDMYSLRCLFRTAVCSRLYRHKFCVSRFDS